MSIKIKFPQKELKRRVASLLDIDVKNVLFVIPTMGGKSFLASITDNYWHGKETVETFTIWEIVNSLPLDDIQAEGVNVFTLIEELREHLKTLGLTAYHKELNILKTAYRQKAKESHPDHGGNAEMFRQLKFAYEILKKHHNSFFSQN
jgi:hypothetical protein